MRPLHLALVWHMHQPYYKDDLTETYLLPWVRLRSTKDYVKMADLASAYPRVHQTFNLVPSLLRQIEDTASGRSNDIFLSLSRKPAADRKSTCLNSSHVASSYAVFCLKKKNTTVQFDSGVVVGSRR